MSLDKNDFFRLDCLAQVAESIPIDDMGIPSPGVQQDIPLGKNRLMTLKLQSPYPLMT